jgi:hypothetical protein
MIAPVIDDDSLAASDSTEQSAATYSSTPGAGEWAYYRLRRVMRLNPPEPDAVRNARAPEEREAMFAEARDRLRAGLLEWKAAQAMVIEPPPRDAAELERRRDEIRTDPEQGAIELVELWRHPGRLSTP